MADVFSIVDADGEQVIEIEPGDAIEVTYINSQTKEPDTFQGVVERISGGRDNTFIELSNGWSIDATSEFGRRRVRKDGRTRGWVKPGVTNPFKKLFG